MTLGPRFALVALVLIPAAARASDYSDFRIPSHSWSRLELGLDGAWSPSFTSDDFNQTRATDTQGLFSGSWLHGHDSERLEHTLLISGGVSGANNTSTHDINWAPPFDYRHDQDHSKIQAARETWTLFGEIRHYPLSAPLALTGRVDARGDYNQAWTSQSHLTVDFVNDQAQAHDANQESWLYSYDVSASFSPRWGRVRDVTGVQRIEFVEERLLHDRVLTGRLDNRTKQQLADLFYTESKFGLVHDLPDRHFWTEFERILREDPAVRSDRLDAYAIFHAADPLVVSSGFGRMAGSYVGPVITFAHENEVHRTDLGFHDQFFQSDTLVAENMGTFASHIEDDRQEVRAGAELAIERPLSLCWQLSGFGTATSDVRALDRDLRIVSTLAIRYWQGERWYWETQASQQRRTGTHLPDYVVSWAVTYGSRVSYFLEDHVSIDLGISGSQTQYVYTGGENYLRRAEVHIGISYRSGSLTAPGLFAPVRPIS